MKKLVVALGGNALEDGNSPSAENQLKIIKSSVKYLVDLIEQGHQLLITHGNGPQVGRIVIQNEMAKSITPSLPFDICGAMSQGMIGYQIQQAIHDEFHSRKMTNNAVSIVTQVVVDKKDKAFSNLTKPIGPFYTKEEAEELQSKNGYTVMEDSGRGYRRVVASPLPVEIVEIDSIKCLMGSGFTVIAGGGGGVPVIKESVNTLKGVAAVIDKDFASAKIAEEINADMLIILTAVDRVCLNYGKENQKDLERVSIVELDKYITEKHFAAGSMLPKVMACKGFVSSKSGRKALITSLDKVKDALEGKSGTMIG